MNTCAADQTDQRRLILVSEASARIGSTLDVRRTAQELADVTVPLLADFTTVDLAESVPSGDQPPARPGAPGNCEPVLYRAGAASVHDNLPEAIWAPGEVITIPRSSPLAGILSSGQPYLEAVLAVDTWSQQDPGRGARMRRTGMHSVMVVPIQARGTVLGVTVFMRTENPVPFDEDDLLIAEEVVSRAALSLDSARSYTRERAAALALQRSLLPAVLHGGAAVEVASRYLPADADRGVGGDWFDVIALPGARVALVVGDVVGHGIQAAATMGRLRTAVQTLAVMDLAPEELLTHLDSLVWRLSEEDTGTDALVGATCLYAVYNPVTRRCTMARAGHPPPAIVGPGGDFSYPELPAGAPLGLGRLRSQPFESVELELAEGSLVALFTDGLVETRGEDIDVGMDRLRPLLSRPRVPLEDLCSTLVDALPVTGQEDDVAVLLARTRSLTARQADRNAAGV